jgi:hypothetical protein
MENNNGNKKETPYWETFERMCLSPKSDKELDWIAGKLIEWAEDENSVTLLGFCAKMAIPQSSLYAWEEKNPKIKRAMSLAKSMVGARREKLALENKFNAAIVNRTLGVYDDRVRAYDKEMKAASSGEDKAPTINVVLPAMPNTDVVPKKRGRPKNV